MGTIALLPDDQKRKEIYLSSHRLPEKYMEDFTLLGFVVDQLDRSVFLLERAGYHVEKERGGAEIRLEAYSQLMEISSLFRDNRIEHSFGDVAESIYQA